MSESRLFPVSTTVLLNWEVTRKGVERKGFPKRGRGRGGVGTDTGEGEVET